MARNSRRIGYNGTVRTTADRERCAGGTATMQRGIALGSILREHGLFPRVMIKVYQRKGRLPLRNVALPGQPPHLVPKAVWNHARDMGITVELTEATGTYQQWWVLVCPNWDDFRRLILTCHRIVDYRQCIDTRISLTATGSGGRDGVRYESGQRHTKASVLTREKHKELARQGGNPKPLPLAVKRVGFVEVVCADVHDPKPPRKPRWFGDKLTDSPRKGEAPDNADLSPELQAALEAHRAQKLADKLAETTSAGWVGR